VKYSLPFFMRSPDRCHIGMTRHARDGRT
jgi:hypothetical protein